MGDCYICYASYSKHRRRRIARYRGRRPKGPAESPQTRRLGYTAPDWGQNNVTDIYIPWNQGGSDFDTRRLEVHNLRDFKAVQESRAGNQRSAKSGSQSLPAHVRILSDTFWSVLANSLT